MYFSTEFLKIVGFVGLADKNMLSPTKIDSLSVRRIKRKQENVATKADKRKYEDKRDRCFQEHWLEKIPWLQNTFDIHIYYYVVQ